MPLLTQLKSKFLIAMAISFFTLHYKICIYCVCCLSRRQNGTWNKFYLFMIGPNFFALLVHRFHKGEVTPVVTEVSKFMETLLNDCSGEIPDDSSDFPPDPHETVFLVLRVMITYQLYCYIFGFCADLAVQHTFFFPFFFPGRWCYGSGLTSSKPQPDFLHVAVYSKKRYSIIKPEGCDTGL